MSHSAVKGVVIIYDALFETVCIASSPQEEKVCEVGEQSCYMFTAVVSLEYALEARHY